MPIRLLKILSLSIRVCVLLFIGGLTPIFRVVILIAFSFLVCLRLYQNYRRLRVLVLYLIYVGALLVLVIYVCIIRRGSYRSKFKIANQLSVLFLILLTYIVRFPELTAPSEIHLNYRGVFFRESKILFILGILVVLLAYMLLVNNFLKFKLSLKFLVTIKGIRLTLDVNKGC